MPADQKQETEIPQSDNTPEIQPYGVVNIKEMKKPKTPEREDDHLWYNKSNYWLAISAVPTIISLIIGYFYRSFLILAAMFPLIAIFSFNVRKFFRDRELDKEDWLK